MSSLPDRRRAVVTALLAVVTALAAALAVTGAPAAATTAEPFVHGTETVPVYSYTNAVRESVWVDTTSDNDGDGKPDKVAVDIVRPREAAAAGIRVPVIMEASPYYSCCGRGNESQIKGYDANGVINDMPLYYDNYFVPRGYAFVGVDLAGTNRSTGCEDTGGPEEVGSAKAVIDWLNGRDTAHYADGSPAVASWTSGRVGMIGKSWDGTIANAVAATGVKGLATIVPVSAISSWYDYMRLNGVPRADGYPGGLAGAVGRSDGACDSEYNALNAAGDDATGNFNAFWAQRDYRLDASKVRASVFAIHGLNDENVFPMNLSRWWSELSARHVPRKLWLTQEGHADPFDINRAAWVDTLHQWFDYWLQGLHNNVMHQPQVTVERQPGQWQQQASFPAPGAHGVGLPLGSGTGTITDNPNLTEVDAVSSPTTARSDRLAVLSNPLSGTLHLSGTPTVTLRVKVDKPDTELTAKLVDYGTATRDQDLADDLAGVKTLTTKSCWGESTATDSSCYFDTAEDTATTDYGVLARGWQDAAHDKTLTRQTPLTPGQWYTITWNLQPQDQLIAKGHTLGVVLSLSDEENTTPNTTGATVTVDLSRSHLQLPVAGSSAGLSLAAAAPRLSTAHRPESTAPAEKRRQPLG
jgi:X-Pro dipeptidyl-peptidase